MLLATALAVLAFQQASISITTDSKGTAVKMSAHERDSTRRHPIDTAAIKKLAPATDADIASAFADAGARALVAKARAARLGQDTTLNAYEANTLQRITLGFSFTTWGRERIAFRSEGASRVRWARGVGAQIDVTGKRSVAPMFGGKSEVDIETAISPVPYYPGRDNFWLGLGTVYHDEEGGDADNIVNPLARAGERFYTYKTGDSITFHLPDKTTVQLRELEVRPRNPGPNAVIGSFWFDTQSGQLVRAAFRMSQPLRGSDDNDPKASRLEKVLANAFAHSAEAAIDGVAIEYGLHDGRFWLPRSEVIEAHLGYGPLRVPMKIEEQFTYASVNALDSLPQMRARRGLPAVPPGRTDTVHFRDSVVAAREKAECESTGQRSIRTDRYDGTLGVMVMIPCDAEKLAHAAVLPKSIFDSGEEFFSDAERDALLKKAESMMPAVPYGLRLPRLDYGFDMFRYNRVEGLSGSVDVVQQVAPGTELRFSPRMGTADRVFNGELAVSRINGQGTRSLIGYRRLNAVNDWGHPLSFSAGLSAFLFGRDEGFYYRSTGAELSGDNLFGNRLEWRVFTEQESDAIARTNVSLPRAFGSSGFGPQENITAQRARESGASIRQVSNFGLDPNGFRLLSDLRLEGAGGDFDYGRGALDLTVSHPIGRVFNRSFSASLTGSAGTSAGTLPIQRNWYLGGTNSVRGQPPGALSGNSYWLTRTELGYGSAGWRREAYFDLGWAGERQHWDAMGRPASGVGLGWSFMDGLFRLDVAKGIFPTKQWHTALYMDARF